MHIARTDTLANYRAYSIAFLVPVAVLLALLGIIQFCRKGAGLKAFACSCVYLTVMRVGDLSDFILACCRPRPGPNMTSTPGRPSLDHTLFMWGLRGGRLACAWPSPTSSSCTACSGGGFHWRAAATGTEQWSLSVYPGLAEATKKRRFSSFRL